MGLDIYIIEPACDLQRILPYRPVINDEQLSVVSRFFPRSQQCISLFLILFQLTNVAGLGGTRIPFSHIGSQGLWHASYLRGPYEYLSAAYQYLTWGLVRLMGSLKAPHFRYALFVNACANSASFPLPGLNSISIGDGCIKINYRRFTSIT
jgi:hypothetical protein